MLTGYFDDSGTHDDSTVVVMGGLIANEPQWEALETAWSARLKTPTDGRGPIRRFHMAACEAGEGEFLGWGRAERDNTIFNFRQIILDHQPIGYACAIARKPWNSYIVGSLRRGLGDAEQHCVIGCIIQSLKLAHLNFSEKQIALVFDNRPHREEPNRRVFAFYQRHFKLAKEPPEPVSITFLSSEKTPALQAADMVAWEFYRHAQNYLGKGSDAQRRAHFQRLIEGGKFAAQIADSKTIRRIAKMMSDKADPQILNALGEFVSYGKGELVEIISPAGSVVGLSVERKLS